MTDIEKIKSLSVIIPAFNEEAIIEKSISLLFDELNKIAEDYEIIVVDDCSFDRTPNILEKLASKINDLKFVHNDVNEGLGSSLRKGFSMASKELVFYTDADLPIDYDEIYRAVKILKETRADFITGFRFNRTQEPIYRIVCSFVYNWLIRLLFGVKIKDINFSFKLVKRDILKKLNLKAEGSFIDAEMIIKADYLGYKIEQIGVTYFPRRTGLSNLAKPGVILKILYEIIKYYYQIIKIRKDAKIFNSN